MSWDGIGALAELVGAIAVVATLLYLAAQIRQNTTAMRGATFQSITDSAVAYSQHFIEDGDLARLFRVGLWEPSTLGEEDARRFNNLMLGLARRGENLHYQSRLGLLDDSEWQGLRTSILDLLASPGARLWWSENASHINPAFREFVHSHLRRLDSAEAHAGADARERQKEH